MSSKTIKAKNYLKSYLGGFFYFSAGVYMLFTKTPDVISIIAIISCFALAAFSVTRYKDWSAIGGGMLIAGSLFLQSLLAYRCVDCIRADIFIFIGMLVLTLKEQGRNKKFLLVMAVSVAIFLAGNVSVHYNPKTLIGLDSLTVIEKNRNIDFAEGEILGDKLEVITVDNKAFTLEIGKKPILLFSPTCGACSRVIEALIGIDRKGNTWIPVQAYGDTEEGSNLLRDNGYAGESYVVASEWSNEVPVLITKDEKGAAVIISGQREMLKAILK